MGQGLQRAAAAARATRPVCATCGRRIEMTMNGYAHLKTVAGINAERDHSATRKGV